MQIHTQQPPVNVIKFMEEFFKQCIYFALCKAISKVRTVENE